MKRKLTWFDRLMAAVTFAEANEHVTAKKMQEKEDCLEYSNERNSVLEPLSINS